MMESPVQARPREECVLEELLGRWADDRGEAPFAVLTDGTEVSYARMEQLAASTAAAFAELGVSKGDPVVSWLPNGLHALRVWFGANLLGAVYVPINTSYRGTLLEHVLENAGASVAVVHADLVERLEEVASASLQQVIVVGGQPPPDGALRYVSEDALDGDPAARGAPAEPVEAWDPQSIIYTSGTTGPSKGVISSYAHLTECAATGFDGRFGPDDRYMINLPLFHVGGTIGVYGALRHGGSIALVDAFDTDTFWDVVRETGTTCMTLLGVMANFLMKAKPRDDDADNPLQTVFMVPLSDDVQTFSDRFDVTVVTMFNMTEISIPIISVDNPTQQGTCGELRSGMYARLVDEHDNEVPDGEVGELILRSDRPWALNSGYWQAPEATARALRNGWFHTGDAFQREDGQYYFVDRMKDAIRRRGENISSFEVERELLAFPAVREAAAVAVASEYGEDEVLAIVAPVPGEAVDPAELVEFLIPRMAHFMVPRYIRVVDELPRTPTSKVRKHVLRNQGLTPDCWDRESAGMTIKRERIG